ncbi:MAG: V-type ATP synthase subunit I [Clostridia bacterium]|nr:V-type ATP synthase subunit I [Clostridia bacterium]
MAIAEMRKLNLAAMSYDRDKILDALQKTGAAEVKQHTELQDVAPCVADSGSLSSYLSSLEAALALLCAEVGNADKENKVKDDTLKDGFDVSYSEFMSSYEKKDYADELTAKINVLADEKIRLNAELSRCTRTLAVAAAYSSLKDTFSSFAETRHVCVKLGTIAVTGRDNFLVAMQGIALADFKELASTEDEVLILAAAHKTASAELDNALSSAGFTACPYSGDITGEENYNNAISEKQDILQRLSENSAAMYALKDGIRPLKVYCDYVGYQLEKAELSDKFLTTQKTFLLEAYVPKDSEQAVSDALKQASDAVYFEYSDPAEDETPPTLMRNNKVVSNFESITNMYSVPSSREFDPNTIMAIFYSLFLGFIMADIGYGILMLLGGGYLWYKNRKRESGLKRLSGVFAIGGIFTILWGFLFNSFFGVELSFMPTLMPNAQSDMWSFAGIQVPAVLVIALLLGTFQLGAGYVCKAVQCWRRKQIMDGICDGITWALFSLGAFLAIIGLTEEANVTMLAYVGGIMVAVGLVVAMFTAGRHEKVIGKFTKGFGAAYGVINYLSDILSYARLYGLMLSGMVIGGIVSEYGINFVTSGNVAFIILGVVLLVVGHVFNVAISLLGAYIHDARLQYVEFYGKFYEGEGELFTPVGSQHKYIYLNA